MKHLQHKAHTKDLKISAEDTLVPNIQIDGDYASNIILGLPFFDFSHIPDFKVTDCSGYSWVPFAAASLVGVSPDSLHPMISINLITKTVATVNLRDLLKNQIYNQQFYLKRWFKISEQNCAITFGTQNSNMGLVIFDLNLATQILFFPEVKINAVVEKMELDIDDENLLIFNLTQDERTFFYYILDRLNPSQYTVLRAEF